MPARSPQTYTAPSSLPAISGSITLKAVTDLPARLYGGNAQEVEVSGLDYTLHLDIEKLPVGDGANAADKWTVVWDAAADIYSRVKFTDLSIPGLEGKVDTAGDTMTGALAITNATASTSPITGALIVAGGVGIGGKLNMTDGQILSLGGGNYLYGTSSVLTGQAETFSFSNSIGSVNYAILNSTKLNIALATASTSTTTGALTVAGGIGAAGSGWFGGTVVVNNPTSPAITLQRAGVSRWTLTTTGATGDTLVLHNNGASAGVQLATQAATAWSAYSDLSLKENLQPQSVRERMQAGDYWFGSFDWKHDGHRDVGVTAQSVATVFPEWVDDIDGKLAVQEAKAGLAALAYAQEVDDELTELRKELKALRVRVAELEGKAA